MLLVEIWSTYKHDCHGCRQWREWVRERGVPVLMRWEEVAEIAKDQAQVGSTSRCLSCCGCCETCYVASLNGGG